jgi:hypothetical protein
MLDDQWRLVKKYHLNDKATRITDIDIQDLLAILKDGNASRIYTRLTPMKSRYKLFPEYWYYLSCAAMATGHFKEGREACDIFFKVNRSIFRKDPMVGTVALNKALMLEKDPINLPELKRCLEIVWDNNHDRSNWAQDYIVASLYNGILHNKEKAVEILEHAIACLESEMSERKHKNKNIASLARTLGEYHAFLFRLTPDEPMPTAIRTSEFISFSDKLRYLARSKTDNVWETIKDDIRGTALHSGHDDMTVTIPVSWLLNDDIPVKLKGLFFGRAMVELKEKVSDRKYSADNNFSLKFEDFPDDYPEPTIDMFAGILFQLVFDHPEFPVTLTFAVNGMECKGDDFKLFRFSFSTLGKTYQWQPESGLETPSYSSAATRQQRRNAFLSKYPLVPLDISNSSCPDSWIVNGINLLTVSSGEDISLEYRNVSRNKFRPCVRLVLMNEYGMVVWLDKDTYFDKYTISERTVPGLFFDDHYVDYNYRYMSPNETRIFSVPKFTKAKYLLISVEAKYDLVETFKQ